MNLRETAQFAVRGVLANKLRSALTMSGILIGVAAVIILISAGTGASKSITDSVSALGSNTLTITANATGAGGRNAAAAAAAGGVPTRQGATGAAGNSTVDNGTKTRPARITLEDAQALVDPTLAPDVLSVAPVVSAQSVVATYAGASHTVATFAGTTPSYLVNDNLTVQAGAAMTDSDYTEHRHVALLGPTVAKDLVGGDGLALVGQTVQLSGISFQVVGILGAKGSTGPQDQDDRVVAPLTSVQDTLTGYGNLSSVSVKATGPDTVTAAQDQVNALLAARHGVPAGNPDFTIFNPSSLLATISTITTTFTLLLGAVAGISLFVGGIGVMNIMLVTVTERTREIGIRKAIGAQRRDIVRQFLMEAVLLSLAGGTLGVIIGVLVGSLNVGGFQLVVAPYSVVLAFVVSVGIGLFFGIYPANRAAALRPIDALRYE